MPRAKHVPLRTCIVCRRVAPKRELIRLVRDPDGEIVLDPSGKLPGRGAYLCRAWQCVQSGASKKLIDRALRARTTPERIQRLRALLTADLPQTDTGQSNHSSQGGQAPTSEGRPSPRPPLGGVA